MSWNQSKPSSQRGYGADWRKLRYQVLADHPTCQGCGNAPSTDVDHIKSKRLGGTDARSNLQALCGACHRSKTAYDAHPEVRPREPHPGAIVNVPGRSES